MGEDNIHVQASEEVSYDSLLKGKTLNKNRDNYCLQQLRKVINDVIVRTGETNLSILEI